MKHPVGTPIALAGLVIGFAAFQLNGTNPVPGPLLYVGIAGVMTFVLVFMSYIFRPINRTINEAGRVVKRGIPNPEQIRTTFIQSTGREPTVEEVAGLHQMARAEYNQAMISLGLVVGGAAIGIHELHDGGF